MQLFVYSILPETSLCQISKLPLRKEKQHNPVSGVHDEAFRKNQFQAAMTKAISLVMKLSISCTQETSNNI